MTITLQRAAQRAHLDLGWLTEDSSLGQFDFDRYQSQFVSGTQTSSSFGCLERLVDAIIQRGGHGLPTHQQSHREIISVVLRGRMWHQDSAGHYVELPAGSIQLISAGSAYYHSEFNHCPEHDCHVVQIWIKPRQLNPVSAYQWAHFPDEELRNQLRMVVSPTGRDGALPIRQNAHVHYGLLDAGGQLEYAVQQAGAGVYVFLLEGRANLNGHELLGRDAAAVTAADQIQLTALETSRFLVLEVPLD
jgi:redox-sensitive bicupin YhaK (pirin superfamily)